MDRNFWKTVVATALGGLIALAVGYGVVQSGLAASLLGDLGKPAAVMATPPEPAASAAASNASLASAPLAAAPAATTHAARVPAPESTPNGSLPELGAATAEAPGGPPAPRAPSGDVLVINPAGGGPKLLTNVPDAVTNANLTPAEREQRQAEIRRKDSAWKKFYERPASCDKAEGPALVECANHYIRAKRSFDALYTAGKL